MSGPVNVYAILDDAVEETGPLFEAPNHRVALRNFKLLFGKGSRISTRRLPPFSGGYLRCGKYGIAGMRAIPGGHRCLTIKFSRRFVHSVPGGAYSTCHIASS